MKLSSAACSILFLLATTVAYAADYDIATCSFLERADQSGWCVGFAAGFSHPVSLASGQKVGLGVQNTGQDGVCLFATGTDSSANLSVSLTAASGSDLKFGLNCVLSGQVASSKNEQKNIGVDEFAFIDHRFSNGDLIRTAAYLAKPGESGKPNWALQACNDLASRMTPVEHFVGDEAYQVSNIVGNWETFDQPFATNGAVQISYDPQSKVVSLKYCDSFTLWTQGVCKQTMNWTESGTYSPDIDGFKMAIVGDEANTSYTMRVDANKKNSYARTWGSESIQYSRQ